MDEWDEVCWFTLKISHFDSAMFSMSSFVVPTVYSNGNLIRVHRVPPVLLHFPETPSLKVRTEG